MAVQLNFHKILPSEDGSFFPDKQWIDELLSYSDFRGTEYCFTSLFIWADVYKSMICRYKDWLIVRSSSDDKANYVFPAGRGDLKEVIDLLMEDAASMGKQFVLTSIPSSQKSVVEELFPDFFNISPVRDSFDYIYEREHLATLTGKKYQSKRNFIARFKELDNWKYESIDYNNPEVCTRQLQECRKMNDLWCIKNGCIHSMSMNTESCAVRRALKNFIALRLKGGILRVNSEIVAYTLGEPVNSDTFIVHVEKAFSEVKGSYPMINQSFILHEAMDYQYINREDDAGDEGLRAAKLSYHPLFMEEKFSAVKK